MKGDEGIALKASADRYGILTATCRNPECGEVWIIYDAAERVPLCRSCRWLGTRAMLAGMFVGGLVVGVVRALL